MRHYHVLQGLQGGYMPDSNNYHTSRRSAEADARWLARDARDSEYEVRGSAKAGLYTIGDNLMIEITECDEPDCGEE